MQSNDPQTEINYLQSKLDLLTKEFDMALGSGAPLVDIKKILHEVRILRDQIIEYSSQNSKSN